HTHTPWLSPAITHTHTRLGCHLQSRVICLQLSAPFKNSPHPSFTLSLTLQLLTWRQVKHLALHLPFPLYLINIYWLTSGICVCVLLMLLPKSRVVTIF